jgi:hypothetical protein
MVVTAEFRMNAPTEARPAGRSAKPGSSLFSMGAGAKGPRSIKAGLPLMSFANGRNFRIALRLIVSGVGSGESANRRLGWTGLRLAGPRNTMAEDATFAKASAGRLVGASLSRIHPLMNPIGGLILRGILLWERACSRRLGDEPVAS